MLTINRILYQQFPIGTMQTIQPRSTQLLQQLAQQPIFYHRIEQDLKKQHLFESQDFNRMPYVSKQRVSEKLLQNRIRRIQINMQKKQQVENILEKRKLRQREITTNMRNRLEMANKRKQEGIRQSYSQQENRKKGEEIQSRQRLMRFQANLQKIERGREKVQQKKNEYIFRIQRKTEQSLKRANNKKRFIQSVEQAQNDQIHLEEWNSYKEKLIKKYEGKMKSSPDRLYQDFKQKNNLIKHLSTKLIKKQVEQESSKQQEGQSGGITSNRSIKSFMRKGKQVSYFGIHQQSMLKKTVKDIQKLRIFLDKQGNFQTFDNRQDVLQNFEKYLLTEILNI